MCMILNRMTLTEIAERLKVKNSRTAETWCRENMVSVQCERKRKFVWNLEFETAFQSKFLKHLEKLYPMNFHELYNAAIEDDFIKAYQLTKDDTPFNQTGEYFPISDTSKDFLDKIK